jgi:hypothetical protein
VCSLHKANTMEKNRETMSFCINQHWKYSKCRCRDVRNPPRVFPCIFKTCSHPHVVKGITTKVDWPSRTPVSEHWSTITLPPPPPRNHSWPIYFECQVWEGMQVGRGRHKLSYKCNTLIKNAVKLWRILCFQYVTQCSLVQIYRRFSAEVD